MYRVVNDSVHGHYDLPELCWAIIDTPAFQRLRNIKQLGLVYKVYPGAMHSRFEHSLGTAYLARRMIIDLSYRCKDINITSKEILMVTIAGLCHDLGHTAFSHMFEEVAKSFPDFTPHEHMSWRILKYIYNSKREVFEKYDIYETEIDIIGQIIFGSKEKAPQAPSPLESQTESSLKSQTEFETQTPKEFEWNDSYFGNRKFFYDIVSNSETGIDVDKFDYISRDCKYANVQCSFDPRRIFEFAYIDKVNDEYRVAYNSKIQEDINYTEGCMQPARFNDIESLYQSRSELHRRVYRHKTVIKLEKMVTKIIELCKNERMIPVSLVDFKLVDMYRNIEVYIKVTDHILTAIAFHRSNCVHVLRAQNILKDMESRRWLME